MINLYILICPDFKLRVKSKSGLWSESFEKSIEVLPEPVRNITITPSTTNWTTEIVELHIEGVNINKLLTPDGTNISDSEMTYTAYENGEYRFVGFNERREVVAIFTYVVDNIDRVGKTGKINPSDGKWSNKDVRY